MKALFKINNSNYNILEVKIYKCKLCSSIKVKYLKTNYLSDNFRSEHRDNVRKSYNHIMHHISHRVTGCGQIEHIFIENKMLLLITYFYWLIRSLLITGIYHNCPIYPFKYDVVYTLVFGVCYFLPKVLRQYTSR